MGNRRRGNKLATRVQEKAKQFQEMLKSDKIGPLGTPSSSNERHAQLFSALTGPSIKATLLPPYSPPQTEK